VLGLEQDLKDLEKSYYKVGLCDIPFLIDDMDAIPVAIANTLKPITEAKLSKRGAADALSVVTSTGEVTVADVKATLAVFRAAAARYAAANKGRSFKKIDALVPSYINAVPQLRLPGGTEASAAVMIIENDNFPPDIGPALSGAGGWVVIGDAKSNRFGEVYINSSAKSATDKLWYQY
jgi:hypothetical protein